MTPTKVAKAVFYPLTASRVLIPLVTFWLLMSFAHWGGILGYFLSFIVLPALIRYQMVVLEARARGVEPETPDVDSFNWWGNLWTLLPLLQAILIAVTVQQAGEVFGSIGQWLTIAVAIVFWPASLAVLAITRSPLQSINPVAIGRLMNACADTIWIASVYLVVTVFLQVQTEWLPVLVANFLQIVLTFSFFSLLGSLIEPYELFAELTIPDALEPTAEMQQRFLEKSRVGILTHAYGLISRDNRGGGLKHITEWIAQDPEPQAAWIWFFERMTQWQEKQHALFFAQHAVRDYLAHGEDTAAVKLVMRCLLLNEQFRPFAEDIDRVAEIAENSGNKELAAVLKGR